jgi:hypothetical protein
MKGLHLRVSMPQTGSSVLFFAGLGHRQQDANVAPLVIKTPLAIATIGHRQLQVEGSPSPRRAALPISREARQPMRILSLAGPGFINPHNQTFSAPLFRRSAIGEIKVYSMLTPR